MARTPVDGYRGLIQTRLDDSIPAQINSVVARFADCVFAGEKLSIHLTRFLRLTTRLTAYLDSRDIANQSDVTISIDLLDYLTSTSKWWAVTRQDPGLVLRPPSRDARSFIKSIADLQVGGNTLQRISGATEKLSRFLEEHEVGTLEKIEELCNCMLSAWALLSAFSCKAQGRNVVTETDFETAYDFVRILLFYVELNDFMALTAVRRLGMHNILPLSAVVSFSPAFEKNLNASVAANLERIYSDRLAEIAMITSGASRSILTNSLKFLGQLQAVSQEIERLEAEHYDSIILGAMNMIERVGIPPDFLMQESSAISLFENLRLGEGVDERIQLLIRRIEGLIVDATGNKDFLLQYARLVPRLVSLLLLIACKTKESPIAPLEDSDIKRGLILLYELISAQ
ncbi:MAG: hypothetical protein JW779_16140 [Candidatus Thorarchaeota archaeon]|nr:hypothetical protein [Candidatus Thorarchaeota archaeon]